MESLVDSRSRAHRTLRVSVTDRCQLRCRYCLPDGAAALVTHDEILRFEEIERIVAVGARLGLSRIRLTGGEPLLRRGCPDLVRMLRRVPGVESLALTTNGILLGSFLPELVASGLDEISISLDTVDRDRFRAITGADELPAVLDSVDAAARTAALKVELNALARRGASEPDIVPLLEFARPRGMTVRFIEMMPFEGVAWTRAMTLPGSEIREIIAGHYGGDSFEEIPRERAAASSARYRFTDGRGGFGLVTSVSSPFCDACDRLRLRSDGQLFNCLYGRDGVDLRAAVRSGTDEEIAALFLGAVRAKGPGGMKELGEGNEPDLRVMSSIGG